MEKNPNAKFVRFALSAAACFALLFAVMLASAVSAAPLPEPTRAAAELTKPAVPVMPMEAAVDDGGGADLEAKMKGALTAVKKVIGIDDGVYPNFNYYYYPDASGGDNWNFNWYSKDGYANINVTVLGSGRILYYGKYEYSEKTQANQAKFAELSKKEAAAKAEAFLKKMLGGEFDGYRLHQQSISYPSDRYSLVYVLSKNGYDYPDFQLYVDVDKLTGDILSFSNYSHMSPEAPKFDYQKATSVISREEALKAYLDDIGLELAYASYYDWEAREYVVHPVYRLKSEYGKYISAADGSVVDTADVPGIVPLPAPKAQAETANDAAALGGVAEVHFSEAELAELAKARNYITAEKAIDIIAKAFGLDLAALENFTRHTNLQSDYMDKDKYLWSISLYSQSETMYENHYASLDAKDGTIIYYSGGSYPAYYDYGQKNPGAAEYVYTYKQAREIVMKKLKEICPVDIEANFELGDQNDGEGAAYYSFTFPRKVNGILFDSNSLYVSFDNISGRISGYGFQWYDKAKFPKLEKLVSPEKALESIAGYAGYDICYISSGRTEDGKISAALVYKFGAAVLVDPFTGKCIGWDFKEAKAPEAEPDYKDLGGHWSEKTVWTLTDNGIYVWGGSVFDPDAAITKGEFVGYLKFFAHNAYYFTRIESSIFVNQSAYRLLEEYGAGADAGKALTKQEAAKIICELAGYGELGKHTEIFAYPFNDDNCDGEYKGYVAIIKAFGLILGDHQGNYDGTKVLTRAEAAAIVYNIVMTFAGK